MKKILTLFSVLLLTVSMWGADTNYTMLEVTNFTVTNNGNGTMRLDFDAKGKNGSTTYYYDMAFNITPTEDGFVGTFGTLDGSMSKSNSVINWVNEAHTSISAKRFLEYASLESEITISLVAGSGNQYTMSGKLIAQKANNGDSGSNKIYNFTNMSFTYDPYKTEPAKDPNGIEFNSSAIAYDNGILTLGNTEADLWAYITLKFANAGDNIAAGSYYIGTDIIPADGSMTDGYYAEPNPSAYYDYWNDAPYFLVSGSVEVSYSQDNKQMTVAGTVTSGHGTEIAIDVTGANPWYVPEPETIELTVSNVSVTGTTNLSIGLTATPNNFMIGLNGNTLAGATIANIKANNTYAQFEGGNYSYMDATKTEVNALSIVATGNTDEYKLNATIVCKNKNTYVMKDVIFTYETPNAWTEEPKDVADFTFTSTSGSEEFLSNKGYMLFTFTANSWDKVEIALKASAETAPAAATYSVVNDNPANGDIVGSAGKVGYTYNPSMVTLYGASGYQRFFVRGGSVIVGYSQDNKTLTMTGDVTTYRGTTITLNLSMENPFLPKEKTLDITSIDATITTTGMDFDIVTASKFDPSEVMLSLIGTAKNPLAIVGSYNYSNFESWYSYADTKDGYYEFKTGSTIEITNGEGGCVMNGTLLCQNGWTYFIEDAPITYSMAVSELADQTALLNRAMNATIDLTVQRSFVDGVWQTICLPFDIANIAESPLAGATVKSVTSCSLEGETLMVMAEDVTSMTAGMPYLIKWEGSAPTNPVFENVTIKTTEGSASGNFVANLNAKHIDDVTGKYMVVLGNGLAPMTDEGTMKGFRAFFQLDVPAGVAPRKFAFVKNEATGIKTPDAEMQDAKVLVKGQLMLLSGDKVYNVQAQELK